MNGFSIDARIFTKNKMLSDNKLLANGNLLRRKQANFKKMSRNGQQSFDLRATLV